eukprot:1151471-Pelagomonas_calceolata.AAC.6
MNCLPMRSASHLAASVSGRECCASSLPPSPCMSARHLIHTSVGTHAYSNSNQPELLVNRTRPHQRTHVQQCLGPRYSAEARKLRHRVYSSSGNLDSTSANDSVYPLEKTKASGVRHVQDRWQTPAHVSSQAHGHALNGYIGQLQEVSTQASMP